MTPKEDLLKWVDDQDCGGDLAAKYVLGKLAAFADAERFGWSPVKYLMKTAMQSERKIRYLLRDLEALGLIEKTDRIHRLEDSTRSVPLYRIAPLEERFMDPESIGAQRAPIPKHGCTDGGGMGAQGVHPHKETKEPTSETIVSSERGREREQAIRQAFLETEAAYPKNGLGYTDREASWAAFQGLDEQGVDVLLMPACAGRFAADPALKKRSYPIVGMDRWITQGRYRGWLPEEAKPEAAAVVRAGPFNPPEDVRAVLIRRMGGTVFTAWLPGATWRPEDRTIITRLGLQADRIGKQAGRELAAIGVRVEGPTSQVPGQLQSVGTT